ncbi:MAG: prepilin peptidase [Deltaproteobacteria bacterium]|nr:prepilin peptidase [Deltaproteobacteria bacterium]
MSPLFQYVIIGCLGIVCAVATVADLRTRRIPNWLTFPAIVLGFALNLAAAGWPGLFASAASFALCGGCFLVLFMLGGMGAGDVKMMAAVGALASWPLSVYALMYTAVAGGVIAIAVLTFRGRLGRTLAGMLSLKTYRDAARAAGENDQKDCKDNKDEAQAAAPAERVYVPYGPAIALGTLGAVLLS